MDLLNFNTVFSDESGCKAKWKEMREKRGVICLRCDGRFHYWKSDKESYECKQCQYKQGLRADTIMRGSMLPYRYWFATFHLLTSTKKSLSTKVLHYRSGRKQVNNQRENHAKPTILT